MVFNQKKILSEKDTGIAAGIKKRGRPRKLDKLKNSIKRGRPRKIFATNTKTNNTQKTTVSTEKPL